MYYLLFLLFPLSLAALDEGQIQKTKWKGIPVIFLEDARFPTYTLSIYFSEGAGNDPATGSGEAASMFHLLTAGTTRYDQRDILDNLDFFGASYGVHVTHEYSSYQVSGLLKDIIPTMKKICHLFKEATFPREIVKRELGRAINSLDNLVSDHGALATRVFRELSMAQTPYARPVEGTIRSLNTIESRSLKKRLKHFNKSVAKRIYLTGPKEMLGIRDIISNECGWQEQGLKPQRKKVLKTFPEGPQVYLVTVPRANQAQVRIGRYLNEGEGTSTALNSLLSDYMSGGLSAKMLRELRTKRGLIYSGGVVVSKQRDYGRALISTYTRNEKVVELITVIKDIFARAASGRMPLKEFRRVQGRLVGKYPFMFEENANFLDQLLTLDHAHKSYGEFFNFKENVSKLGLKDMARGYRDIFNWNKMSILVLGSRSLKPSLEKLGAVTVRDYKEFL